MYTPAVTKAYTKKKLHQGKLGTVITIKKSDPSFIISFVARFIVRVVTTRTNLLKTINRKEENAQPRPVRLLKDVFETHFAIENLLHARNRKTLNFRQIWSKIVTQHHPTGLESPN